MESEKYWKYHLSRTWEDTKEELRKHRTLEIGIAVGTFIIIVIKYLFFDNRVAQAMLELSGLIGTLAIAFLVIFLIKSHKSSEDIFTEGQKALSSSEEKAKFLEEQQKAKLEIIFNETSKDHCSEYVQNNGQMWGISVRNESPITSIKNVTVKLTEVYEGLSLVDDRKVCLEFARHDRQRSVDICAKDEEPVKVFRWMKDVGIEKKSTFYICHIENVYPHLIFDVDKDDYKIKIVAFGDGTSPKSTYFKIGLKDGMITMWPV